MGFESLKEFGEFTATKFFVELGDLTGEAGKTIAENGGSVGDGVGDAVGRLVEDESAVFDAKAFEGALAFAGTSRKKTEKQELVVRKAGGREGGEERGGTGNGDDRDAMANGESDQAMAGIGDEGHASITDQCNGGTFFHGEHEFGSAGEFVMLVVADERLMDLEMIQEFEGVAGVFAGDLLNFFENAQGAEGDVFEVADGSGDQIEAAARRVGGRIGMFGG